MKLNHMVQKIGIREIGIRETGVSGNDSRHSEIDFKK